MDLPGTYSLLARSVDEQVSADAVRELAQSSGQGIGRPGVAVVVLDATALTRSLYLLAQVAETGVPLVVALTMLDLVAAAADSPIAAVEPDTLAATLGAVLGIPVVPVYGRSRGDGGQRDLARAVDDVAARSQAPDRYQRGAQQSPARWRGPRPCARGRPRRDGFRLGRAGDRAGRHAPRAGV